MSADEDVPHRRLPPSPSGRKSHILAGSKSTGHSPVFEKYRPLARFRKGPATRPSPNRIDPSRRQCVPKEASPGV